jgi:hypothetical protein
VGLEGWSYAALSGGWAGPEGSIVAEQGVGWMSLKFGGLTFWKGIECVGLRPIIELAS